MVKDQSDNEKENQYLNGYSFWLAAKNFLYAPSQRKDSTYHGICYTSCGALAGMRNSLMGRPGQIDPVTHPTMD